MTARRIYLSPPDVDDDERDALVAAFDSGWIAPLGPDVDAFEAEFAARVGAAHAVALSSGTAALHLALIVSGIGPGDDVLTSSLTFAATTNAIRYVGARPVLIDSERSSWNIDPALVEEAIDRRTRAGRRPKALVAVDLYGQCARLDALREACRRADIPFIEDAAEALGASYRGASAGSWGDIGVFSFNGNKIITTSGGGMLVTGDAAVAQRVRHLATQAREPAPHYEHVDVGYNYRLSNLLAALGRAQLRKLDRKVARRRAIRASYVERLGDLPGLSFMPEVPEGHSTFWLTCAQVDPKLSGTNREAIRLHLASDDIEARPVWKPMHLQPVFRDCEVVGGAVAADLFENGLCLPSGSSMSDADLDRVILRVRSAWPAVSYSRG